MIRKIQEFTFILIGIVVLMSCSMSNSRDVDQEKYVGVWKMKIKKLPRVGDVSFMMHLIQDELELRGFLVLNKTDTITLDSLYLDGNWLVNSYLWDKHNVGFKVRLYDNNKNNLKGNFMRFFDVEGVKLE